MCGFDLFCGLRLHGRDSWNASDKARLNQGDSVTTVIEGGNIGTGGHLDASNIAVQHDIQTDSRIRPFDQIV